LKFSSTIPNSALSDLGLSKSIALLLPFKLVGVVCPLSSHGSFALDSSKSPVITDFILSSLLDSSPLKLVSCPTSKLALEDLSAPSIFAYAKSNGCIFLISSSTSNEGNILPSCFAASTSSRVNIFPSIPLLILVSVGFNFYFFKISPKKDGLDVDGGPSSVRGIGGAGGAGGA
jgi:hypothetical protein